MKVIPSSYQKLFDRLAPYYRIIDFLSLGSTSYLRHKAVRYLFIKEGGTVVDLMCGTGNNINELQRQGMSRYIGLDASVEMMFRSSMDHLKSERIKFIACNVLHSIPAEARGDHLICTYGLKCISFADYEILADTVDHILKPGGSVSFLEFRMPENALFRFFTSIYVNVVCGAICLAVTGSLAPTRDLVKSMNPPIDPELFKDFLEKRNIQVTIEEQWMSSAVFVHGRKPE